MTSSFERLARASDRELQALFVASPAPPFDDLVGFQWRGYNTDPNLRFLGLRKFIKAFFRAEHGDEGCNVRVEQNDLAGSWLPRMRGGKVDAFAFYLVAPQDERRRFAPNPRALVIDYGASPRNPWYHVERTIRDYLVRPLPQEPDVLLGRAWVGVGRAGVTASFFVLDRLGRFSWPV